MQSSLVSQLSSVCVSLAANTQYIRLSRPRDASPIYYLFQFDRKKKKHLRYTILNFQSSIFSLVKRTFISILYSSQRLYMGCKIYDRTSLSVCVHLTGARTRFRMKNVGKITILMVCRFDIGLLSRIMLLRIRAHSAHLYITPPSNSSSNPPPLLVTSNVFPSLAELRCRQGLGVDRSDWNARF